MVLQQIVQIATSHIFGIQMVFPKFYTKSKRNVPYDFISLEII